MPKVISANISRQSHTKPLRSRATVKLEQVAAEPPAIASGAAKKSARAVRPYDRPTKTERVQPTVEREGSSRGKIERSPANVAESSTLQQTEAGNGSYDSTAACPKVIAREFVDDDIVMLHCECLHDADQIRLQYRDGAPLPRPNTMGFELYNRLRRQPVAWNGSGTPLVYRALVSKRGSYVLRYKGRVVWEYSTDDWAAYWERQEKLSKKPYDWDAWNRAWKCIEHGFRNPIPGEKVEAYVHVGSKLTGVVEAPGSDAFDYLPTDLFRRCDLETTHRFLEYKRRTGKVAYLPGP
ncbi:uncharacterized protein SCHCODRAFT_02537659 [Schizophyllum commune H4-8]|nr:uncharacterized protein SCHCODRAFT_02537659 [Schizophyllum commune H4-8]KAI5893089.1 hypothetical protein SCHCODRAFT_02537659 [Schizophyllum commune H4-8]